MCDLTRPVDDKLKSVSIRVGLREALNPNVGVAAWFIRKV